MKRLMDVKFSAVIVESCNLYLSSNVRKSNGRARFAIMRVRRYDNDDDDDENK